MSEKRKHNRVPLDIYLNKYVAGVPYMAAPPTSRAKAWRWPA